MVDVATAQEVLDRVGCLSRIDLMLAGDEAAAAIRALLPAGAALSPKSARSGALDQMTRAFRLNLPALSLLALVVGMFLIYNTMTFSVVQRRPLIGTLRALGVTRRQVFALVLGEAALVGVAGSAAGLGLGVLLARGLLELVVQTINDLYFVLTVQEVAVPLAGLAKGALLGIGGTPAGGARCRRARRPRTAPRAVLERSLLERRARRSLPRLAAVGRRSSCSPPGRSWRCRPRACPSPSWRSSWSSSASPAWCRRDRRRHGRPAASPGAALRRPRLAGGASVAATLSRTGVAVAAL